MSRTSSRMVRVGLVSAVLMGSMAVGSLAQEEGDTLSVAFESDFQYLDPALAYDFVSIPAVHLVFDTLVGYDSSTNLVPRLATSMPTISDDGLTYTFDIRTGVPFVRKGEVVRELTAEDVVASLNRLLNPNLKPVPSPVAGAFFAGIEGAEAVLAGTATEATGLKVVDDDTLTITLSKPDRSFLNALAMTFGSIVPVEIAADDGTAFAADLVGTGPYYLDSYTPGQNALFKRNPHYWDPELPKNDAIDWRLDVTAQNQLLQAQANELDLMGNDIPVADWAAISTDPTLADRVVLDPVVAVNWLTMDTSGPESPFQDVLVRQAVNHVIDKQNLVRIFGGRSAPAGCIFPPGLPGHDAACDPYPYSVERATELMAETGNTGFSTQLYTDTSELSRLLAESMIADLAQIGIEVELIQQDWDTLLTTMSTPHAAPLSVAGWLQDFPDPSDFIDPILTCAAAVEGGANGSWFCDPSIDERLAEARTITDLEEAIPVYQGIQADILAQAPFVPTTFPYASALVSDRVAGVRMHPLWYWDLPAIAVGD